MNNWSTEIKIFFKLIKSFTIFFKKNFFQILTLSILTIVTISLFSAIFISNSSLNYQESLLRKNSYPTQIPYYSQDQYNSKSSYLYIQSNNQAKSFLTKYFPGLEYEYKKEITQNNITSTVSVFDPILFKKTTYELWKLYDGDQPGPERDPILWNYNQNHNQKIPFTKGISLYALVVSAPEKGPQNQALQLLSNNPQALSNTFKINFGSTSDPNYKYCFLFNDIAGYQSLKKNQNITTWNQFDFVNGHTPKYTSLLSTQNQQIVLHFALNSVHEFTKNQLLSAPYNNQQKIYVNTIWNTCIKNIYEPTIVVDYNQKLNAVNKYIAFNRNILYSWFGGGLSREVTAFSFLSVQNIQGLYKINIFDNPNQPIPYTINEGNNITLKTNIMLRPTIYQADGKTLVNLSNNQVAFSRNASSFIKNTKIGDKFTPFFAKHEPNAPPPLTIVNNIAFNQVSDHERESSTWNIFVSNSNFEQMAKTTITNPQVSFFARSDLKNKLNFKINPNFMENIFGSFRSYSLRANIYNNNKVNIFSSVYPLNNRQGYIIAIISIMAFILLIGCLIIIITVTHKIIMKQKVILGIMKANGLGNFLITMIFATYFWFLTLISLVFGLAAAYLLAWGINHNFTIETNVYSVAVHFNFINPLITILLVPIISFIIISIVVAFNVRQKPLILMSGHQLGNQNFKGWQLKFYHLIQKLGFQQKITIRLFSQSKLRLLFVIFITGLASIMTYLAISTFNINTYINSLINDFNTNYAYSLNTFSGITNKQGDYTTDQDINQFSTWYNRLPNEQTFITQQEFNNNQKTYKQIIFYKKNGQPDWPKIYEEIVQTESEGFNFKNRWFKAASFVWLMNESKNMIIPTKYIDIYMFFQNIYNSNKTLINQLADNSGIVTIGFQIVGSANVTNGALTNVLNNYWYINPQTFTSSNMTDWIKPSSPLIPPDSAIFTKKWENFRMLASGADQLNQPKKITLATSDSPAKTTEVLNTTTNAQASTYLYSQQKMVWNKIQAGINQYNQNPSSEIGKCVPLLIDIYSFKTSRERNVLNPGEIVISKDKTVSINLNNSQQPQKITYLIILASVGTTSNLFFFNYAPYLPLLKYSYISQGIIPPSFTGQENAHWKYFNTMYTDNPENLLVNSLGIREDNGAYTKKRYDQLQKWTQEQTPSYNYHLEIESWINDIVTDSQHLNAAKTGLAIILWIIQMINIIVLCGVLSQILIINSLIFNNNLNIINNFRAMGYGRFWIFKRLFIAYLPLIFLSGVATFPLSFLTSTFAFKQFSLIFRVFISPVLSYFNFFFSIFLICLVYLISFIISWYRFENKNPPYKQIGHDN